ncbi:MAG: hypothetical protein P4L65_05845 [Legionella sp.]|nr:hypothetical protein [Legionella sp.]
MPKIKDIAIVAKYDGTNPVCGEAPRGGDNFPLMTSAERINMESRLFDDIKNLMHQANQTHFQNNKQPGTNVEDPHYITRLSTNEFFFYTREPLTLQEFEKLQNKIAEDAQELSSGVQLVLGSFAVLTSNNQVMNVTPHITCGQLPSFNFLIKNSFSDIDVRYTNPEDDYESLAVLVASTESPQIPQIKVNGVLQSFTFNNVVQCKTAGGEPFLTAVDICLDHSNGVAKANIESLVKEKPDVIDQPISHMVIANSVGLHSQHCFGPIMHVDPKYSLGQCKLDAAQVKRPTKKGVFGKDEFRIYELEATTCQTLAEAQKFLQYSTKILDYFKNTQSNNKNLVPIDLLALDEQIIHYKYSIKEFNQASTIKEKQDILDKLHTEMLPLVFKEAIQSLEKLKFGDNDNEMQQFIAGKTLLFNAAGSNDMKQAVLDELNSTIKKLEINEASAYIKTVADDFRLNANRWTIKMTTKANAIDSAMSKLSIEERCNFLSPDSPKLDSSKEEKIFEALAYRRNLFRGNRVEEKERDKMGTYKKFKEMFLDGVASPKERIFTPKPLEGGEDIKQATVICQSFKRKLSSATESKEATPNGENARLGPQL